MTTIYDNILTYNNDYKRRNIRDLYDAPNEDFYMNGVNIMVDADNDHSDTSDTVSDTDYEDEMEEDDIEIAQEVEDAFEEELQEPGYN